MVIKLADVQPWEDPLYLAMGRLVVIYNQAEFKIRDLLTAIAADHHHDNRKARILTAELGSMGLDHALRAVAGDLLPKPAGDAVTYGLTHYERVRFYRNLYVHGILMAAPKNVVQPMGGQVLSYSAKGALTEVLERVSLDQIDEMTDHAQALATYMWQITLHLRSVGRPDPAFGLTPLPDRPPLPPPPQKSSRKVRDTMPPPQS